MKRFEPSRTYSSPSRRAVVRIAAESEPDPASVSAYAASHSPDARLGRKRSFCSSRSRQLEAERAELLHREDQPARRADLRDLLDRDERQQRPGAGSAVLLVEEEPEDAVLAEELDDVPGELVRPSISAARGAIRSRASVRTSSRISSCSSAQRSQGTREV